jgi:hypothetical protein
VVSETSLVGSSPALLGGLQVDLADGNESARRPNHLTAPLQTSSAPVRERTLLAVVLMFVAACVEPYRPACWPGAEQALSDQPGVLTELVLSFCSGGARETPTHGAAGCCWLP